MGQGEAAVLLFFYAREQRRQQKDLGEILSNGDIRVQQRAG